MPRVKRGVQARARHKKVLKQAKGYYGARSRVYRVAKQAVMHSAALLGSVTYAANRFLTYAAKQDGTLAPKWFRDRTALDMQRLHARRGDTLAAQSVMRPAADSSSAV